MRNRGKSVRFQAILEKVWYRVGGKFGIKRVDKNFDREEIKNVTFRALAPRRDFSTGLRG